MLVDTIAKYLAEREARHEFSGVVLIVRNGETFFEGAYGYAVRSWKVHNTMDTRFRVASVGKLFTAVAVLRLIEQGMLTLDTPVHAVSDLVGTTVPTDVTIEHLLQMRSGIADWFEESEDWDAAWTDLCAHHNIWALGGNRDYLPLFAHKPPLAAPGSRHQYSNSSYILLGLVVEHLTGRTYFDHVRTEILERADLRRTDFLRLDEVAPEMAEGYVPVGDGCDIRWKRNVYLNTPGPAADGGVTSTAGDLQCFLRALRDGQLLGPALTARMLDAAVAAPDEEATEEDAAIGWQWRYGYGLFFILGADGHVLLVWCTDTAIARADDTG